MSFLHSAFKLQQNIDPLSRHDPASRYFYKGTMPPEPPKPPGAPNPNDAANAAQSAADQFRQRRGLLATVFAGNQASQPVTGKTQLGT